MSRVSEALMKSCTGKLPHGMWAAIGDELKRIPHSVLMRWNRVLAKSSAAIFFLSLPRVTIQSTVS